MASRVIGEGTVANTVLKIFKIPNFSKPLLTSYWIQLLLLQVRDRKEWICVLPVSQLDSDRIVAKFLFFYICNLLGAIHIYCWVCGIYYLFIFLFSVYHLLCPLITCMFLQFCSICKHAEQGKRNLMAQMTYVHCPWINMYRVCMQRAYMQVMPCINPSVLTHFILWVFANHHWSFIYESQWFIWWGHCPYFPICPVS